jgi:hypothetical protein
MRSLISVFTKGNLTLSGISKNGMPLLISTIFTLVACPGHAQEALTIDKGQYGLFKPVPENLMRELSPDRPDKTESPYTLDAGRYSLEMDFVNFTYSKKTGVTAKAWNIAPFNMKFGLFSNIDIQFVFDDYLYVRTKDFSKNVTITQSGVGDVFTRLKINLWGDDSGKTACAILPYLKIPTNTDRLGNGAFEGGVICPFTVKAPGDVDVGMETAVSFLHDDDDSTYHEDFINSITFDHSIVGKLGGYVEFFSEVSTHRHSGWVGTIDLGLEFLMRKNVQFDCGCNFGVTSEADEFNPFTGITFRF